MKTFSCTAPPGTGGLGLNLGQLIEDARDAGELESYFSRSPTPGDERGVPIPASRLEPLVTSFTPVRFSQAWRGHLAATLFDRAVAKRIAPTGVFVGFSGQALATFRRVQATERWLLSPTAHILTVDDAFKRAFTIDPIERSWVNGAVVRRALREYELADRIIVGSDYVRESFLSNGIPADKLISLRFRIPERFTPPAAKPDDGTFRVVYVGSLTVGKGVPRLVEAFSKLRGDARLTLVGGWASRGMRRYLTGRSLNDDRIEVAPGDPLPHLHRADLLVHPSYSDGFGYAPMEALACGVPVVVTTETGMKAHVREGVNGWIVPAGNADVLHARMESLRSAPLRVAATLGASG